MIEIFPETKIYITAPAGFATGGCEALHLLCHHLRNELKAQCFMFYIPEDHPSPNPPQYSHYETPFVRRIEDESKNILIVPEIISHVRLLSRYKNIRKGMWWLSVDNFFLSKIFSSKFKLFIPRFTNFILKKILKKNTINTQDIAYRKFMTRELMDRMFEEEKSLINLADYHLAQSFYAVDFLKGKGVKNVLYLSEYLNPNFLKINTDLNLKEDFVVFNPLKGLNFTKKIIKASKGRIKFVPIINMTREQVIQTLQKAKIYIDFGNHPGKDRLPREAAILGCCVITGKKGSAAYYEDVPIPEKYKFDDRTDNIPLIVNTIDYCIRNYNKAINDFDYYREFIKNEPQKFLNDLKKTFKVQT